MLGLIQKMLRFCSHMQSYRLGRIENALLEIWERNLPQCDRERMAAQRSRWTSISRELNGKMISFHYSGTVDDYSEILFDVGKGSRRLATFSVKIDDITYNVEFWAYDGRFCEISYYMVPPKKYTAFSIETINIHSLSAIDPHEPIIQLPVDYDAIYANRESLAENGVTVFDKESLERIPKPSHDTWHVPLCQIDDRFYVTLHWDQPDKRVILYDFIDDEDVASADTIRELLDTAQKIIMSS